MKGVPAHGGGLELEDFKDSSQLNPIYDLESTILFKLDLSLKLDCAIVDLSSESRVSGRMEILQAVQSMLEERNSEGQYILLKI